MWLIWAVTLGCEAGGAANPPVDSDPVEGVDPLSRCVEEAETGVLDCRVPFPDPPEGGLQFVGAPLLIPPYSDTLLCTLGTYSGERRAISRYEMLQVPDLGHHTMLLGVIEAAGDELDKYQDGDVIPCDTMSTEGELRFSPLVEGPSEVTDGGGVVTFPEGVAQPLESGLRWLVQSHYVNPTGYTLKVQDAINLGFIPIEEVEHWSAPFTFNHVTFSLPPQQVTSVSFTCTWEARVNILHIQGHLHEWGERLTVEHLQADGSSKTLYEVDWREDYIYQPHFTAFEEGEVVVEAGESFRTTCQWNNTTDQTLRFPDEMCVGLGSAWPMEVPFNCLAEEQTGL